jgi:hypothetical protein
MGRNAGRRLAPAAAILVVAALSACGSAPPNVGQGPGEPFASPPPANIVDELVRNTMTTTGLSEPIEVLEIREGPLDELRGLTPEAQTAASVVPNTTGRQSLDRRAWRVRMIATDASVVCVTTPCVPPQVYVEAFLDAGTHGVIAVVMGAVPANIASDAP